MFGTLIPNGKPWIGSNSGMQSVIASPVESSKFAWDCRKDGKSELGHVSLGTLIWL
jgi:hypothetical protein